MMTRYPEVHDHPDIACALCTGHPRSIAYEDSVECADCGVELGCEDKLYRWEGKYICTGCVKERILDKYTTEDIAFALNIECTTLQEYIAKMKGE